MNFIKGTIIGMVAGTVFGVMENDMILDMCRQGKKKIKKLKRKMSF